MSKSLWICRGGLAIQPTPFCPAGILNITPDSFSDGTGALPDLEGVLARAYSMRDSFREWGCGMLDLGAESTRPDAVAVDAASEAARLAPILARVLEALPDLPVSIDTCRASVAAAALDLGAHAINDVSACSRDPGLLDVLVQYRPGYVLSHGGAAHFARRMTMADEIKRGESPVDALLRFFEKALARLVQAGLPEERIVLDPGIGFGKNGAENWAILRDIEKLHAAGRPLYVGLSRKTLFGWLLNADLKDRDIPTQTTVALLAARGVAYHRVHDVKGAVAALRIALAMTGTPRLR